MSRYDVEAFKVSDPEDTWPGWARDALAAGGLVKTEHFGDRAALTWLEVQVGNGFHYPIRVGRTDYVVLKPGGGLMVMSACTFEHMTRPP